MLPSSQLVTPSRARTTSPSPQRIRHEHTQSSSVSPKPRRHASEVIYDLRAQLDQLNAHHENLLEQHNVLKAKLAALERSQTNFDSLRQHIAQLKASTTLHILIADLQFSLPHYCKPNFFSKLETVYSLQKAPFPEEFHLTSSLNKKL